MIEGNKLTFARRTGKILQVLYRRGLLRDGLVHFSGTMIRGERKPVALAPKALSAATGGTPDRSNAGLGRRLRLAMEELGPAFIKLGQFLSTRPDLVAVGVAQELALLQDQVLPFSRDWVDQIMVTELGNVPRNLFLEFDYIPLASASIAQVHRATLAGGEKVAVKIQRPRLANQVRQDLTVFRLLQPLLQRSILGKMSDLDQVAAVFTRQLQKEMDFVTEALNLQSLAGALDPGHHILVPGIHWTYSTGKVLTMDYMAGMKLEEFLASDPQPEGQKQLARKLVVAILEPFFRQGVFHGDPHPGNLLFTGDGELVLLDYGIVGRLDEDFRYQSARLLTALKKFDPVSLVECILALGEVTKPADNYHLYEDAGQLMELVRGVNNGHLSFDKVIYGMIDMAVNHGIRLPGSFYLFGKALTTTEAVARRLDPSLNLVDEISPLVKRYYQEQLSLDLDQDRLLTRSLAARRDYGSLPLHLTKIAASLREGKQQLIFAHRGLEPMAAAVRTSGRQILQGLVILGLLAAGALLLTFGTASFQTALGGASLGLAGLIGVRNRQNLS